MTDKNGVKVLVLGSGDFNLAPLVSCALKAIQASHDVVIDEIVTGAFSGTDTFVREYAKENKIKVSTLNVDLLEGFSDNAKIHHFSSFEKIPQQMMKDPKIKNLKQKLLSVGVDALVIFPNAACQLGDHCKFISMIAKDADLAVIDMASFIQSYLNKTSLAVEGIIENEVNISEKNNHSCKI